MICDEILLAIDEYRGLVIQTARIAKDTEQRLAVNPGTAQQVSNMDPLLRERQRDYAILLRATDIMRRRYRSGASWTKTRDDIQRMDDAINDKYARLVEALCSMRIAMDQTA